MNSAEFNKSRIEEQFWIDPYGKVVKYKGPISKKIMSIHYLIAQKKFPNAADPEGSLIKLGWIRAGSYLARSEENKPNQAQINTMDRLGFLTH